MSGFCLCLLSKLSRSCSRPKLPRFTYFCILTFQLFQVCLMNARERRLQLTVESRQVRETALCFFHTLILHRTVGKLQYNTETSYTFGSLGLKEVLCDEVDFAYVRVNSPELCVDVEREVDSISDAVNTAINAGNFIVGSSPRSAASSPSPSVRLYGIDKWENLLTTQIKLEFFQKRKRQWPMPADSSVWEVWNLDLEVVKTDSTEDFCRMREYVGESLGSTILSICQLVNRSQYLPGIPAKDSLCDVYDDRFTDCEPYLYRIESNLTTKRSDPNKSSVVMRLFRDSMKFSS
ncbi:hypothetical protein M3Y97_00766100 [Aphelenchoides bicaudatus]|nr:hypothetical protein M3Y97_00766100 [Aphelenchoides bicaudatus]